MQTIAQRLDALPDFLAPLKDAAARYAQYPSVIGKDGVLDIGHRPWVPAIHREKLP